MKNILNRGLTILTPILGAGAVGACPLCWVGSASLLTYLGLGVLIPIWRQIAIGLIILSAIGFILDFRSHRNPIPLTLLAVSSTLLFLGRYIFVIQPLAHLFSGIEGFAGWPIWGTGAILIIVAVVYNKRLFRKREFKEDGHI